MALQKVYFRTYRPIVNKERFDYKLVRNKHYAQNPTLYSRSFLLIQKEMLELFEYIEPSDVNLKTYSLRLNDVLIKICTEIETNFKAILRENQYSKDDKFWGITDYRLINTSHKLSGYEVTFPVWTGTKNTFRPFEPWDKKKNLFWYDAYNACKHDKVKNLKDAKFFNVLNAFSALFIVYTAQFGTEDFATGYEQFLLQGGYYDGDFGIGQYLMYKFSAEWLEEEKYDIFTENYDESIFQKYNFDALKTDTKD